MKTTKLVRPIKVQEEFSIRSVEDVESLVRAIRLQEEKVRAEREGGLLRRVRVMRTRVEGR